MAWDPRGAAVVGIGMSELARDTGRSNISLLADAFRQAVNDCGIDKSKIDGIHVNAGGDVDRLAENLGLQCRWAVQYWTHGRLSAPILQEAALVVTTGLADYVACLYSIDISERGGGFGGGRSHANEDVREGGGPHGETPQYGLTHPGSGAATAMRRYMTRYDTTPEQLGSVAVTMRAHARLNPAAVMQKPMTLDDYLAAPQIIEPLRLFDFCAVNDGAVCMIVTSGERARDLRQRPVFISGMQGLKVGTDQFIFSRPGLGVWQQPDTDDYTVDERALKMAGVTRDDVDGLMVYDSFSPQVIFALEEYGYCGPGEGARWMAEGNGVLGGKLPVNTHGGHLSEGMLGGWGHHIEAVRQLRGDCGERQIADAETIHYIMGSGVSIVWTR